MLVLGRRARDLEAGHHQAEEAITSGAAFEKFRILVRSQGGDVSYLDDPGKFPKAKFIELVEADRSGSLSRVHARMIGEAAVALGAGRAMKEDSIDHAVGFIIHRKVGDHVDKGEPLFTIHANDAARLAAVREGLLPAFAWSENPVVALPLFYE
jgi:pyrimidine-nucleoside phosphorylase